MLVAVCGGCASGTVGSGGDAGAGSAGLGDSPSDVPVTMATDGSFVLALPDVGEFVDSTTGRGGAGGNTTTTTLEVWPPPGFINATDVSIGAYAIRPATISPGAATAGSGGNSASGGSSRTCSSSSKRLYGLVRDFRISTFPDGHPDFENRAIVDDRGIVKSTLGSDEKPVYAHPDGKTATTTGQTHFDQWYDDLPDVNMTFIIALQFMQNGNVLTFAASSGNSDIPDSSYFPLDGVGFGNNGLPHNYSFTTEIHTNFTYNGGEIFTFQGDDDVFVFINHQLAIDLGGIHAQETQSVDLDAQSATLGITKGQVYPLAVFNAERHTSGSNFRLDTTMAFTDCGQVNGQEVIF